MMPRLTGNSNHHRFRPSIIRVLFSIAVIVTICIVLLSDIASTSAILDKDSSRESSWWLGNAWELGFLGMKAQQLPDASVVHASSVLKLIRSSKENDGKAALPPPNGCESTIMLICHCEKGNLKSRCNYNGYERSVYLLTQFGNDQLEWWPAPSKVYALQNSRQHGKKKNYQEIETVNSVAFKFGLEVDESYSTRDLKGLSNDIMQSVLDGEMCGKLTLMSWKHSDLPHLAHRLGTYLTLNAAMYSFLL
jgi:hypothetical protein